MKVDDKCVGMVSNVLTSKLLHNCPLELPALTPSILPAPLLTVRKVVFRAVTGWDILQIDGKLKTKTARGFIS